MLELLRANVWTPDVLDKAEVWILIWIYSLSFLVIVRFIAGVCGYLELPAIVPVNSLDSYSGPSNLNAVVVAACLNVVILLQGDLQFSQ